MDEAQALADRVAIIAGGRIVAEGAPETLAAQRGTEIRFTLPAEAAPAELPRVSGEVAARDRNVEISTDDPMGDLLALTGWAAGRGAALEGLTVTGPHARRHAPGADLRPRARRRLADIRKLLAWLVVGLVVAMRTFRWERAA
jgi:ABC-type multidrug transport system ATPase subunit